MRNDQHLGFKRVDAKLKPSQLALQRFWLQPRRLTRPAKTLRAAVAPPLLLLRPLLRPRGLVARTRPVVHAHGARRVLARGEEDVHRDPRVAAPEPCKPPAGASEPASSEPARRASRRPGSRCRRAWPGGLFQQRLRRLKTTENGWRKDRKGWPHEHPLALDRDFALGAQGQGELPAVMHVVRAGVLPILV